MNKKISSFEKNLSLWVILCMIIGIFISVFFPKIPELLTLFEFYNVSLPIAILIFIMIYPMMLKVDFRSVKLVFKNPKGLYITWFFNWAIKPFTMFLISLIFFDYIFTFFNDNQVQSLVSGSVLLGAAPCTAMVFVWSKLVNGNSNYTVMQVATNDILILILFIPIVSFLLGANNIVIEYNTLFLSIGLFVVIPLIAGIISREYVTKKKGEKYFNDIYVNKFNKSTIIGLLVMLILIFSFQGDVIIKNPFIIILIAIPLVIQTLLIFYITVFTAKKMNLDDDIVGPCAMIATSNFFELSVAISITMFGVDSLATLVTIVGVLVEVPIMLILVKILLKKKKS